MTRPLLHTWGTFIISDCFLLFVDLKFTAPQDSDNGRFALGCQAACPNQTDSDVVWNIHLLSNHYDISLSCHGNNCTSDNQYTTLLQLEQEFTTDSNNTLHFHFSYIYEKAMMGCVVNTGDCLSASYWLIHGGKFCSGLHNHKI